MATVYLGLGSNIDAERNLRMGIEELRRRFGQLQVSATYRSKAVGFAGDDFLNLVARLESDAPPEAIEREIEDIHKRAGRRRGEEKFSARALDIDLLLYDDLVRESPRPRLPRADVLQYSFVLRPLAELAPELRHPLTGRSMREHWAEFDQQCHPLTAVDVIL